MQCENRLQKQIERSMITPMSKENKKTHDFKITDGAVIALKEKFEAHNNPETVMFRITIEGGGCSGFQYQFAFETEIDEKTDIVFDHQGVKVVIDDISMEFLEGSELVYQNDFGGAFFKVQNPNASSSCGCGTSFSI